jgi:hypothetical protein
MGMVVAATMLELAMARPEPKADHASSNDRPLLIVPDFPAEDEVLSLEERHALARAGRDRAAGRFVPLSEVLDVGRRGGALRRARGRTSPGR